MKDDHSPAPRVPSAHRMARLIKRDQLIAFVERVINALPIDRAAKLSALAVYEPLIARWLCTPRTTDDWLVVRVFEDLGLRNVQREVKGVVGTAPDGSTIRFDFPTSI